MVSKQIFLPSTSDVLKSYWKIKCEYFYLDIYVPILITCLSYTSLKLCTIQIIVRLKSLSTRVFLNQVVVHLITTLINGFEYWECQSKNVRMEYPYHRKRQINIQLTFFSCNNKKYYIRDIEQAFSFLRQEKAPEYIYIKVFIKFRRIFYGHTAHRMLHDVFTGFYIFIYLFIFTSQLSSEVRRKKQLNHSNRVNH